MPPGSQLGPRVTVAVGRLGSCAAAAGPASAIPAIPAVRTARASAPAPVLRTALPAPDLGVSALGVRAFGVGLVGTASPSVAVGVPPAHRHPMVSQVT